MPSHHRTKWQTVFYSQWFLLVNIIVLVLVVYTTLRSLYYNYQVQKEIKQFQEQAKSLEAQNIKTSELLKYVRSDDYVEGKARVELNLVKPGEQMALVTFPSSSLEHRQPKPVVVEQKKLSNPKRWWNYFFNH
jgi:cell division protein FtsB